MSQIETIAVMRLHAGEEFADLVIPAVAQHTDALAFVCHRAPQSFVDKAKAHPKTVRMATYNGPWDNHTTLSLCASLADLSLPKYVMLWDEDEMPPARFGEEFAAWKKRPEPTMQFKCFWTWGEADHIIGDYRVGFGWHDKVYRWRPDLSEAGFTTFNRVTAYQNERGYACPYPYRHLGIMTEAARARRMARGLRSWWGDPIRAIPYDADMTYRAWEEQAVKNDTTESALVRLSGGGDMGGHIRFIYDLMRQLRPERVVELGVRTGVSTMTFLLALRDAGCGRLYSCDANPCPSARSTMRAYRLDDRWEFARADDREWLLGVALDSVDLALIDTSHEHEHTAEELRLLAPRMTAKGVILMHDTALPGVGKPLADFLASGAWKCDIRPESNGMAVLRRNE